MFEYDPEVPAGYQDADLEMLEMIEAADRQADLEEAGRKLEQLEAIRRELGRDD